MENVGKRMVVLHGDDGSKLLILSEDQIALLRWLEHEDYFYDDFEFDVQNEIIDPCEVKA